MSRGFRGFFSTCGKLVCTMLLLLAATPSPWGLMPPATSSMSSCRAIAWLIKMLKT